MFLTFSFACLENNGYFELCYKRKLLGFCHFHFNFLTEMWIAQLEIIFEKLSKGWGHGLNR